MNTFFVLAVNTPWHLAGRAASAAWLNHPNVLSPVCVFLTSHYSASVQPIAYNPRSDFLRFLAHRISDSDVWSTAAVL
jgi:hypothetical protein